MKRVLFVLVTVAFSSVLMAQTAVQKKADEVVKFKELVHDFGKIKQGAPVTYDFAFNNTSDKPVVIETAQASCGCTTPVWPQAPVGKGKTDKITAGFNAAAPGPFNKTITVKVAGTDIPVTLTISGDVLSADDYAKYEKDKANKKG